METKIFNFPYTNQIIDYCVAEFKKGNIGIFPTDTVYGIGCGALNIQALQNLYNIKNRISNKPICILVSDIKMVNKFVKNINDVEKKLIETFWPGGLTIIFDKSDIVPDLLTANLDTIGIRMPNNHICLDIINKFGNPIATSSANISDKLPCNNINELIHDFKNNVSFILDSGILENSVPSTIVRVENNEIKILRKGAISKSDIEKCFGGKINVR